MNNEIEKVDLRDVSEKLKDKIKLAFTEVISNDQWKAMIEAELKRFTTRNVINRGRYDERVVSSGLEDICKKVFSEEFDKRLREYMMDMSFSEQVTAAVRTWLDINRETLVQNAIMSMLTANLVGGYEKYYSKRDL